MKNFLVTLFLFAINSICLFAQNKSNTISDVLLNPIPNSRASFHYKLDDVLEKIDELDGKIDNKIEYRDAITNDIVTNDIFKRGRIVSYHIENQTYSTEAGVNNQTKIRYLRYEEDLLKNFYSDAFTGKYNAVYYKDMFNKFEDMINAISNNTIDQYVKDSVGMGVYMNRNLLTDKPEAMKNLINVMCAKYPDMMEKRLPEIAQYDGACDIMSNIAKRDVKQVMNFATSTSYEKQIVARCSDPMVKAINTIADNTTEKEHFKAFCFLGDYINGRKSLADIKTIINDKDKYYSSLVDLRISQEPISKDAYTKQLTLEALDYVRLVNELHEKQDAERFKSVENLLPNQLFYLTVLCSDEIYTSSFLGIFKRLMAKISPEKGNVFLDKMNKDKFRTFIRMCANYNTLNTFLASMEADKQKELMASFVKELGDKDQVDLEGAVDVADSFGSIDDPALITFLQEEVRKEYEKNYSNNKIEGLKIYYILHSLFTSKTQGAEDSTFSSNMSAGLKLPPINKMPFKNLLYENQNTVYEQVFFYGDEDGKASFGNFKTFLTKSKMKVDETNANWIKAYSVGTKVPLVIYANRPLDEPEDEQAQKKLASFLVDSNIHPSVIIHRGHSYHLSGTMDALSQDNKIVILGSCGGYHNLSTILQRSEDAHIVSSKQVGSKSINDPIIEKVNLDIMNGEDVNWIKIWAEIGKEHATDKQFMELFNDYVPPHKNLGALFLKAYKKLGNS